MVKNQSYPPKLNVFFGIFKRNHGLLVYQSEDL